MTDIVDKATRSRMMSGIKGKDTKPEMLIRKKLHASGFRFRLHNKELPGKPDIVLKKYRAVILVNGCYWHGHNCHLFKLPKSNTEFWENKIKSNVARDSRNFDLYLNSGWRVLIIWECAVKGKTKLNIDEVMRITADWILNKDTAYLEIEGENKE